MKIKLDVPLNVIFSKGNDSFLKKHKTTLNLKIHFLLG